jgi:hypothetical protein
VRRVHSPDDICGIFPTASSNFERPLIQDLQISKRLRCITFDKQLWLILLRDGTFRETLELHPLGHKELENHSTEELVGLSSVQLLDLPDGGSRDLLPTVSPLTGSASV